MKKKASPVVPDQLMIYGMSLRRLIFPAALAAGLFCDAAVAEWKGWTGSRLAGSPDPPLPFSVEKVFAGIPWKSPVYLALEPGGKYIIVSQQDAPLLRVAADPATTVAQTYAEFPGWLIYSVLFDPGYGENHFVYLFRNGPVAGKLKGNGISRYVVTQEPHPHIDPASELPILQWASGGHDGGDMDFGPDGLLYLTTGDGSGDSDQLNSGQTLDDLLGAVLRIDVRGATKERPYTIPPDNPFCDKPGARGEIWAYGLRNPWRMDIDPVSGQVWVGNNGQDLQETAHLVQAGSNYGWSVFEGSHPFYTNRQLGPTPPVKPTIEHPHSAFRSLTGGVVYRGGKWQDLDGAYLYGDYSTGRIWGAKHDGQQMIWHRELADTQLSLTAFRALPNGDLLMTDHLGHGIYRLIGNSPAARTEPFPLTLSGTGLFENGQPAEGVVAYEVNAPAWTDGAIARHWMAVPAGQTVSYANDTAWGFSDGAVLVQTLSLPDKHPVETRIMLRQQGEWAGYSYRWNAAGTDADLVPREGLTVDLPATGGNRSWRFPGRSECASCHARAANYLLGVNGVQLHRGSQLDDMAGLGFLKGLPPSKPGPITNPYDAAAGLEARALAYLHVNCSMCHVESGGGNANMELRLGNSRERMAVFDIRPQHATFGLPDAMLVSPGHPGNSVLLHRLSGRGPGSGQMPPLGTARVDEAAVALMAGWIAQMPPTRKVVKTWSMEDFSAGLASLEKGRHFVGGKEAFTKAGCIQCHRLAGEGGSVGPDLTGVGKRLSSRDMLESILEPSRKILPGFAVPGVDPPLSTMPAGMIDVLEKDEVWDLLYYLRREGRPKVAAVVTEYRHNSHADVIVSRLLQTDTLDGKGKDSLLELVSLYTDQRPANDTSRMLAASHRFPIFPSVREILTLGTGELAVDGILLIAEHGDYPLNPSGNHVYPKRRLWEEILAVFQQSSRTVPVFIDKHLADNWSDAKFIYDSAQAAGVPLMAGSSVPSSWRRPAADITRSAAVREIVAFTYGSTDAYGFHGLECVQAIAEQRKAGGTGIQAVQLLSGAEVWKAFDEHRFDPELFAAAWSRLTHPPDMNTLRERVKEPLLFRVEYQDGLHVNLLELNGAVNEWAGAWRYADDPEGQRIGSTLFFTQEGRPAMHFTILLNGIERMFLTGTPSWPVERTLLTSGALDALLLSRKEGGRRYETPYLNLSYHPTWRWQEPPPPPPMRPWSEQ